MSLRSFAERLRQARAASGLTRAELAQRASLSVRTIRAYENAKFFPGGPALVALARECGTTAEYLLGSERREGETSDET